MADRLISTCVVRMDAPIGRVSVMNVPEGSYFICGGELYLKLRTCEPEYVSVVELATGEVWLHRQANMSLSAEFNSVELADVEITAKRK